MHLFVRGIEFAYFYDLSLHFGTVPILYLFCFFNLLIVNLGVKTCYNPSIYSPIKRKIYLHFYILFCVVYYLCALLIITEI